MCAYYYDETSANRLLGSRHSICDVCVDVKAMGKGVRSQYSYAIVLGIKMTAGRHEDGINQTPLSNQTIPSLGSLVGSASADGYDSRIGRFQLPQSWRASVHHPKLKLTALIYTESAADVMSRPNHQSCRGNRAMDLYRGAINGDVARAR